MIVTDRRMVYVSVKSGSAIVCKLVKVEFPNAAQLGQWYPFLIAAEVIRGGNFTGVLAIKNNSKQPFLIQKDEQEWIVNPGDSWSVKVPIAGGAGSYFWTKGKILFEKVGVYQLEVECGYE